MVAVNRKKVPLTELEDAARRMTKQALLEYELPDSIRGKLVLGTFFEEDARVFELYEPGERPADAKVYTRARLDLYTGEGVVEVFNLKRKE